MRKFWNSNGSTRRAALLVAAAAMVPLLFVVILEMGYTSLTQQRSAESDALARSAALILAAEVQSERIIIGSEALATSEAARTMDKEAFAFRARQLSSIAGRWSGAVLLDEVSGKAIGSYGRHTYDVVRENKTAGSNRTRFVGYTQAKDCRCLVFERQLESDNGKRLLLRILVSPKSFDALLPPVTSKYSVSAIVGPEGRFIARSVQPEARFGKFSSTYVRSAIAADKPQGIYRGITLEGMQNYSAFTKSALTGWSAHVAFDVSYMDGPRRRFYYALGIAVLVSLLFAGLLIAAAFREMAQARRATERIQQTQKLEALGQLTGGIAHDFNNLLTPIVGALDIIQRNSSLDARIRRLAIGALESAKRAGKLTRQLLAFSRQEKLQIVPVNLRQTFLNVEVLVAQGVQPNHPVNFDLADDVHCVLADPTQLEVGLLNLVLNARDASPVGSTIEVRARRSSAVDRIIVEVADHGMGMTPEVQARAFEPFFTTKELGKGTGLGLAQVFGLIKQSGGTIQIESEVGRGTIIRLDLAACNELQNDQTETIRKVHVIQTRRKLLVIDDDDAVRASMAMTLQDAGYSVETTSSPVVGLTSIEHHLPDLVVTDFAMPEMDGAELIRAARAKQHDVKFLIVSGLIDSDALAAACPDTIVLAKPFLPDELIAAVERSLSGNGRRQFHSISDV